MTVNNHNNTYKTIKLKQPADVNPSMYIDL